MDVTGQDPFEARHAPEPESDEDTQWYLTICAGCGLVWVADNIDGDDCPVGTPDKEGKYHSVYAWELWPEDDNKTLNQLVSSNLPDEWEHLDSVALRDDNITWDTLIKDMPKH